MVRHTPKSRGCVAALAFRKSKSNVRREACLLQKVPLQSSYLLYFIVCVLVLCTSQSATVFAAVSSNADLPAETLVANKYVSG